MAVKPRPYGEQASLYSADCDECDQFEARLDVAESDIDSLESRMTTAEGDIDSLENSVTNLNSAVSAKQEKLIAGDNIVIANDIISATGNHIEHFLDGDASGSLRSSLAVSETESYSLGTGAVAVGWSSRASGSTSFAEGLSTDASGASAHAEGARSSASGDYSHTQNRGTSAVGKDQTVIGSYNKNSGSPSSKLDTDHAFIIGNGTSASDKSNAFSVTWGGDTKAAGGITAYDHDSPIGTQSDDIQATDTIATGITFSATSVSITFTPGTYILIATVEFEANSTGVRSVIWNNITQNSNLAHSRQRVGAASGSSTRIQSIAVITPLATQAYGVNVAQTSGTSLSVQTNVRWVRIV